jgi:hypothetical protein
MDVASLGRELGNGQVGFVRGSDNGTIWYGDVYGIFGDTFIHDGCIQRSKMMSGARIGNGWGNDGALGGSTVGTVRAIRLHVVPKGSAVFSIDSPRHQWLPPWPPQPCWMRHRATG